MDLKIEKNENDTKNEAILKVMAFMIRTNEEAEAHVSSKLDAFTRFKKSVNFLRLTPKGFISLVLVLLQPLVRTPRAPHRAK